MRSANPNAAVDLPLPAPVWTISKPFSMVLPATSASCTALRLAILARCRSASVGSIAWFIVSPSGFIEPLQRALHRDRQAGDHQHDAIRPRGDALIEHALQIAEPPPSGCSGTMPEPTSLATITTGAAAAATA